MRKHLFPTRPDRFDRVICGTAAEKQPNQHGLGLLVQVRSANRPRVTRASGCGVVREPQPFSALIRRRAAVVPPKVITRPRGPRRVLARLEIDILVTIREDEALLPATRVGFDWHETQHKELRQEGGKLLRSNSLKIVPHFWHGSPNVGCLLAQPGGK
jgi:hypothetical protein